MNRRQADRSVIAARAANQTARRTGATASTGSVGTNPALRSSLGTITTGPVRRTRAAKMTGAQRNSLGKRSEWNDSMDYFTDPAWSQTVSNQRDERMRR